MYFQLTIKFSTRVSLPLAPLFLGHLYVQLDILQSDERQTGSYHIVTSSIHSTILQHLFWDRCARHLAKCKLVCSAKEKFQSCPKEITDFYGSFVNEFLLAYSWFGLKPSSHPAMEFFDKGMGFSWRACRSFNPGFTCANSTMGPFMGTAGKTNPFVAYDEKGITYLTTTNARWLPYLADEELRYVHYSTNRVWR